MKKKFIALVLAIATAFSLVACGGTDSVGGSDTGKEEQEKAIEITDGKYAELLAGGLNKEQFQFVLAHLPGVLEEDALAMSDLSSLLLYVSEFAYNDSPEISIDGWTEGYDGNMYFNLSDVNNMIKIVTDFQFAEENNGECPAVTVSGDTLSFCFATPSTAYTAEIESAVVEDDLMTVVYKVHIATLEDGEWDEMRTATLSKNTDDLYQIQTITTDEVLIPTWQEQYEAKIEEYQGYAECYALHNMDEDDIPELIVAVQDADFSEYYNWTIYTCSTERGIIKEIYGSYSPSGARAIIWLNAFGPGLVDASTSRFNGETYFTGLKVVDGELTKTSICYFTWEQDAEREKYEANFTQQLEWSDMSDRSLLNNYE